jgi:hypothetical protein
MADSVLRGDEDTFVTYTAAPEDEDITNLEDEDDEEFDDEEDGEETDEDEEESDE